MELHTLHPWKFPVECLQFTGNNEEHCMREFPECYMLHATLKMKRKHRRKHLTVERGNWLIRVKNAYSSETYLYSNNAFLHFKAMSHRENEKTQYTLPQNQQQQTV